jgi:hypothetical protein
MPAIKMHAVRQEQQQGGSGWAATEGGDAARLERCARYVGKCVRSVAGRVRGTRAWMVPVAGRGTSNLKPEQHSPADDKL